MSSDFYPLVSIVIPVFNGSNYMREAIDSALAQTYKNIEVIVVNDGSSDDGATDAIAKSYGDRIRYLQKNNGGCASALNLGIASMRGEYFSWLSHDDVYLPQKIEHQIDLLNSLADKSTIIYGGYDVINEQSQLLYSVEPGAVIPVEKQNIPLFPLLRGLIHGCSLLIPVKYFQTIGVFDETLPSTQDYALWFDFFRVAEIFFDKKILIKSRVHPDQGTHKIAKHLEECNELWSGFLRKLTNEEMSRMEGSPFLFFLKTARFLAQTPYSEAKKLADTMANEILHKTKVSVVMPFYNRVGWAVEAIKSVQAQTHENFELILVDDGSTDNIAEILAISTQDARIRYLRVSNGGPAAARNRGIEIATGNYIAFIDSDDLFEPQKLEVQLRFMEENQLQFCHTTYYRMNLEGEIIGVVNSGAFSGSVFPAIIASCPIAMPTVMGRRSLFASNRFPEEFEIGEDVCLWISIASCFRVGGVEQPLSKVRIGAETAAFNPQKQAIGLINIASFVIHHPHFRRFGRQIKSLLIDTSALYNAPLTAAIEPPNPAVEVGQVAPCGLIARTVWSVRNDGLAITWYRICRTIQRVLLKQRHEIPK